MIAIGDKIRKYRVREGISQINFAKITHMSQTRLREIENSRRIPNQRDIEYICYAFNVDPENFIKDVEFCNEENIRDIIKLQNDYALADKISEKRRELGLSMTEFSELAKIPIDKIYKIENHKKSIGRIYYLRAAQSLGLIGKDQ